MLAVSLIGALLLFGGIVYMAAGAINRGKMSDPHMNRPDDRTLEPRHRGVGFLSLRANWPGLLLIAIGALLLLLPTL